MANLGGDGQIGNYLEQQMVQLEPSPAQAMLEQLKKTGKPFRDDRFPPTVNSLTGEWGYVKEWNDIKWVGLSQKMKPVIFY